MPNFTTYEVLTEMTAYDIEATFARLEVSRDGEVSDANDPYQWYLWRVAPIPDWKLWKEMHPTENPGPYGTPVYCLIAAKLSGLTQGGSENGTTFQRRCLMEIEGLEEEN